MNRRESKGNKPNSLNFFLFSLSLSLSLSLFPPLKGNGILPGTNILPDDPGYLVAIRRGLMATSHHYNLLAMVWSDL